MTTQQLLKPRYKVIADYPSSTFNVGQILLQDDKDDTDFWTGDQLYTDRYPKLYPHLFRKLEWWEERKVEDMPEYLKLPDGRVRHVDSYESLTVFIFTALLEDDWNMHYTSQCLPVTEQDYNNQKP